MNRAVLLMCVCALIGWAVGPAEAAMNSEIRASKDNAIVWADSESVEDNNNGRRGIMGLGNRGAEGIRGMLEFDLPFGAIGADNVISASLHLWVQQADGGQDASIYRLTQEWVEGMGQWVRGTGMINIGSGATFNSYNGPDNGNDPWPGGAGALGDVATDAGEPIVYGTLSWAPIAENEPGEETITDVTDLVKSWADGAANNGMLLVTNGVRDFNRIYTRDIDSDDHSAGTIEVAPLLAIEWVPEPATIGLLSLGALGLLRRRRR